MADHLEPSPRASKRRKTEASADQSSASDNHNAKGRTAETQINGTTVSGRRLNDPAYSPNSFEDGEDGEDDPLQTDEVTISTNPSKRTPRAERVNGTTPRPGSGSVISKTKRTYGSSSRRKVGDEIFNTSVGIGVDAQTQVSKSPRHAEGSPNDRRGNSAEDYSDEDTVHVQPRSSGRERKKPQRFSLSPEPLARTKNRSDTRSKPQQDHNVVSILDQHEGEDGTEERSQDRTVLSSPTKPTPMTPKGILTPSGKKRGRPRKSVVFDQSEKAIEEQFGFKDIDRSTKKLAPQSAVASTTAQLSTGSPSPKRRGRPPKNRSQDTIPLTPTQPSHGVNERELDAEAENYDDLLVEQILENQTPEAITSSVLGAVGDLEAVFEDDAAVLGIKAHVLARLSSPSSQCEESTIPLHLEAQYTNLHNLLTATITTGESNSLLLLGSRGAGKSRLIEIALRELGSQHADEFHTVRLNGFYQTDDKIALREIWRQLGREMNMDENEENSITSYADTMASLLSLLSHPDDFLQDPAEPPTESGSQSANVADMTGSDVDNNNNYATLQRRSKSVIFLLDEFDRFTTHPRQTLLYNLFDIAQSRKAPIAVIGSTTRMDVVECLEKRVKSRFSHRWLHLPSAKSLSGFEQVLKTCLMVDEKVLLPDTDARIRSKWNMFILAKFIPSKEVQNLIKQTFYTTKSVPDLLTALYLPVVTLRLTAPSARDLAAHASIRAADPPSILHLLPGLPTLHLSLLVVAARLDTIYNLPCFNFNVVYDHYAELIARSRIQQTASGAVAVGAALRRWHPETTARAWEDLGAWGAIVPATGAKSAGSGAANEVIGGEGSSTRMWRVDLTLDDLSWALRGRTVTPGTGRTTKGDGGRVSTVGGAVELLRKWCREI